MWNKIIKVFAIIWELHTELFLHITHILFSHKNLFYLFILFSSRIH